jgi:hypothetical protein
MTIAAAVTDCAPARRAGYPKAVTNAGYESNYFRHRGRSYWHPPHRPTQFQSIFVARKAAISTPSVNDKQ